MKYHKSIRFKFLGCLLAVSILPVLIIFIFILRSNSQFYQSQIAEASNNEVSSITTRVNGSIENLNGLLTSLIFSKYDNNSCMLAICGQEGKGKQLTPYERLSNNRKFEYVSSNLIGNNDYAEGVYLFNESGYTYSFVKIRELRLEENYREARWYQKLKNSDSLQVTLMYKPEHLNETKIVFARYFTDMKGKNGSVLAVVCNDRIFDNKPAWGQGFIMDENGSVIYGKSAQNLSGKEKQQIIKKDSGVIIRNKKADAYVYGTLNVNNWKIISEVSFQPFNRLYQKITRYLVGLIGAVVVFVLILLILSERVMISPLEKLAYMMEHTISKEPSLKNAQKERKDEIGVLYRGYDKMMTEINRLIQEKYVSEIQFLKSRLQNLMSQINAHFIFNTLENINCLASIEKNRKIAVMSKSLGDMLRYSIEYEREEEKLSTEIEHIKQYIQIQEIRFENKIYLEQEMEEGLQNAKVLKFMLQPVIENAIEHGLAGEDKPWVIRLKAYREEEKLIIWVQDNGVGMTEEEVIRITNRINHPESFSGNSGYTGIGLSNIQKRLRLLYTEDYGLYIESKKKEGLKVIICLPYHLD